MTIVFDFDAQAELNNFYCVGERPKQVTNISTVRAASNTDVMMFRDC